MSKQASKEKINTQNIAFVQKQVELTKQTLLENMNKLLQRGDGLVQLEEKVENLERVSSDFKKCSSKLKKKQQRKLMNSKIIIIAAGCFLVFLIFLIIFFKK